jgi:hypothetical protein
MEHGHRKEDYPNADDGEKFSPAPLLLPFVHRISLPSARLASLVSLVPLVTAGPLVPTYAVIIAGQKIVKALTVL